MARAELAKVNALLFQDKKLEASKVKKGRLSAEQRAHYEQRVKDLEKALDTFHRSVAGYNRTKAVYVRTEVERTVDGAVVDLIFVSADTVGCRSRCWWRSRSQPSSSRGASGSRPARTTTTRSTGTCNRHELCDCIAFELPLVTSITFTQLDSLLKPDKLPYRALSPSVRLHLWFGSAFFYRCLYIGVSYRSSQLYHNSASTLLVPKSTAAHCALGHPRANTRAK